MNHKIAIAQRHNDSIQRIKKSLSDFNGIAYVNNLEDLYDTLQSNDLECVITGSFIPRNKNAAHLDSLQKANYPEHLLLASDVAKAVHKTKKIEVYRYSYDKSDYSFHITRNIRKTSDNTSLYNFIKEILK